MHWDDSEHAGFTTGEPWLPVHPNKDHINAAAAVADEDSVFHHFRRLIALRHDDPVVVDGVFELLLPDHEQLWVFTRTLGDDVRLVVANCSSEHAKLEAGDVPDLGAARLLLGTHDGDGLELAPWESRIYAL
jgi:oligo-1,6-glucosidase